MNAQDIFYLLGSIYLVMGIIVMVVILIAIVYTLKKLNTIHENVSKRVEQEINEIKEKPRLLASYIGSIVAKGIKNKFTNRDDS